MAETNLLEVLPEVEDWSFLDRVAFLQFARRANELMFDVLLADEVEVYESDQVANRFDLAPAIYVGNAQPLRELSGAPRQTSYTVWSRDEWVDDAGETQTTWGSHQVTDRGILLHNPLFESGANPYECHPVFAWHDVFPRTGIYPPLDYLLIQAQEVAALRWVLFHEAVNFHSLGTLALYGQDEGDMPRGPRSIWRVPEGPDEVKAEYINTQADIPGVWQVLVSWLQQQCVMRHIPGPSLDPKTPSIQTGEAVKQRRIGLSEVRRARAPRQKRNLVQFFHRVIQPVWDYWQDDDDRKLGTGVSLRVILGGADLEYTLDQSQAQALQTEIDLGVADQVEIILRRRFGIEPGQATPAEYEMAKKYFWRAQRQRAQTKAMEEQEREIAKMRAAEVLEQRRAAEGGGTGS